MDTIHPILSRDNFINGNDPFITYVRKRGQQVLRSVVRNKQSFGLVGTDSIYEYDGSNALNIELLEEIPRLRFAVLAADADKLSSRIKNNEPLTIVTSYPKFAMRLYEGWPITIEVVEGCVEAELAERSDYFDAAIELVQSGRSLEANGLMIIEDNLASISLAKVTANDDEK